jgi:triacylglycerol esterase/lipase EstA (alpha/beta hydrolase family)
MPQFFGIGIVIIALTALILIMLIRGIGNSRREPPVISDLFTKEGQSLVVLVHGTRRTTAYLDGMRAILDEVRPEADVLVIQYPSRSVSNADPFRISEQICQKIHELYGQKKYRPIIMVGYSKGALLIRKAFVYGSGRRGADNRGLPCPG